MRALESLGDRDRNRHLQVAAVEPFEDRRGGDPRRHVEVARRAAARAGLALAGEPDPGPVLHPGRDADLVALGLPGQAGAAAGLAGLLDDLAGPAALRARLADREEPLALRVDAAAFAARADDRAVPGLAPLPWQVGQRSSFGTLTLICVPLIAWSNVRLISVSRSRPRNC